MERSKSAQPPDSAPDSAQSEKPKPIIDALNELDAAIHLEEQGLDEVKVNLDELNRMAEEDENFREEDVDAGAPPAMENTQR
jgi:hypothetical protein